MNDSLTIADPLPQTGVRPKPGLYQRLVLAAFAKMNAGSLCLELPAGSAAQFGTPGADVSATIYVRDATFFQRCMLFGDVGFGESFVDGEWETYSIERVISWAIQNVENSSAMSGSKVRNVALNLLRFTTARSISSARTTSAPRAATSPSTTISGTIFTACGSIRR